MTIDNQLLDNVMSDALRHPELRAAHALSHCEEGNVHTLINVLLPGSPVPIHRHPATEETYVLLRGRMFVVFFNEVGAETQRRLLDPASGVYGIRIPKGQWHTVEVVEPSSVFEVKEGPYRPLQPEDIMY